MSTTPQLRHGRGNSLFNQRRRLSWFLVIFGTIRPSTWRPLRFAFLERCDGGVGVAARGGFEQGCVPGVVGRRGVWSARSGLAVELGDDFVEDALRRRCQVAFHARAIAGEPAERAFDTQ